MLLMFKTIIIFEVVGQQRNPFFFLIVMYIQEQVKKPKQSSLASHKWTADTLT